MGEMIRAADASSGNQMTPSPSSPTSLLPPNLPLLSAFLAFAIAQFLKVFTTWYTEKRWDSKRMIGSGGMPSSHSATVMALAVAIGLQEGTGGPMFAIAIVLACVVMYDASGVRLHAGRQAEITLEGTSRDSEVSRSLNQYIIVPLLNQIVCEFPPEHPLSNSRPLRDSLGHTPLQVLAGAMLGCLIAYLMSSSN